MVQTRKEKDSLGQIDVPSDALYGAQTQRAIENFPVSGIRMPRAMLHALGCIKSAAAATNLGLGLLETEIAEAIQHAADAVAKGTHDDQFPVDIFQTGSGTSSNMNANEVIANLAAKQTGMPVHPNDHVNMGQSSNDVIPSAIQVMAVLGIQTRLLPALTQLEESIRKRADANQGVIKTGRTHLMDALPIRADQELNGWADQVASCRSRIEPCLEELAQLPIGGTAVGTGVNAHRDFGAGVARRLSGALGIEFTAVEHPFHLQSAQDGAVALSGQLKTLATSLSKIANDLRWMASGPYCGLGEIALPAVQPGSSIMPGKVNPVIPESVAMVCAHVMGADLTITIAGQAGQFQLNTMLPLIAYHLDCQIGMLTQAMHQLAGRAISGMVYNVEALQGKLARNPILVTRLNPVLGYARAAQIAKRAYREDRPVIEVAAEETDLTREELERLLDPKALT